MYAVVHATCGHAASVSSDRAGSQKLKDLLHAGGYHQWRVRLLADETAIAAAAESLTESNTGTSCDICRVDQDRVLALINEGRPS